MTTRPLTFDDVDATVAMVNACELHDSDEVMWEPADLRSDVRTDGFDPARDWIGVFERNRIVGWGIVLNLRSAWVDVHPDSRERGIGTWLRTWSVRRARELGAGRIGQTIDDRRQEVAAMFAAAGYTARRTSWILRMEHSVRPDDPVPPAGIELRAFRPGDEDEVLGMFEQAFSEWNDRLPSTMTTWRAMTVEREGFEPEDLVEALDGDRIVGGAFLIDSGEVWVDKLAVRRDHRHRGIARALLQTAFRRSFDRGYAQTTLSTDSNTGALTLYERLGMTVHRSFTHHALDL
ncbi:MAG: GNAT family N-acetyltransferase [Actinomycetota bacterium]